MTTVTMADTIGADAGNIPESFSKIAYYVSGGGSIPWPPSQIARFPHAGHVRIDQSPGLQMYAAGTADIADVEPGAGTIAAFIAGTEARVKRGQSGHVYCSVSAVPDVVGALITAGHGLFGHVGYWVADWNLSQAEASRMVGSYAVAVPGHGDVSIIVDAVQWASPSSNPDTVLPGTARTLKDANVDLSETSPTWFAFVPPKPVTTETQHLTVTGTLNLISTDAGKTWNIS